jgi:dTDP-4-amino-4,6-dideoxygalactose transaminase
VSPVREEASMSPTISRRRFMTRATVAGAVAAAPPLTIPSPPAGARSPTVVANGAGKPAVLGGSPVRSAPFPAWPVIDQREDQALLEVLHGGKWFRGYGQTVTRFEKAWAELTGARHCVATANGTSALFASLASLDVGPGDEVILPPYTFVATVNVVLLHHALPVFVDSDLDTFQIDAGKIETAITDRTTVLLPVHLGGNASDLDAILDIAGRRGLPVLEDACQAHLGEWRGRKLGTLGTAGCFSFQASKNLNSGEGGAILTDDEALAGRLYAFHNNSRPRRGGVPGFAYGDSRGANLRLTEFQASLLLTQMTRLEEQSATRDRNAEHLTKQLAEIPGIHPARGHPGCTRNGYHLYMLRYVPEEFEGLPRSRFLEALRAEGVPASGGYKPLNQEPFLRATLDSRGYRRIYPPEVLAEWAERTRCPVNDRLCEEGVWFGQTLLLGPRQDVDDIADAIRKIRAHASAIARS